MRKILLGLTAMAALVLGLVFGSAPAQAASYVSITSAPGTHHSSGCWYHPFTVTMNLDPAVYHWDLDLTISGPDGTFADSDYVYGYATQTGYPQTVTTTGNAFLCGSLDDPGTYTVGGVLETMTRSWTDLPDAPVYGTFTSTFPAPAPAPAPTPTPAPTSHGASLSASVSQAPAGHGWQVKTKAKYNGQAWSHRFVTLQKQVGNRWVAVSSKFTNGQGLANFIFTPPSGHATSYRVHANNQTTRVFNLARR